VGDIEHRVVNLLILRGDIKVLPEGQRCVQIGEGEGEGELVREGLIGEEVVDMMLME
jgi:hypothetical protein